MSQQLSVGKLFTRFIKDWLSIIKERNSIENNSKYVSSKFYVWHGVFPDYDKSTNIKLNLPSCDQ